LRDFFSRDAGQAGDEDSCPRTSLVNYGQDGVTTLTFGELDDQIHRYHLKWKGGGGGWDAEQGYLLSMGDIFILLTGRTAFDISRHPFVDFGCYALVLSWYALNYLYLYSASICISGRAFPVTGLTTALAVI
jgi:hypothetical protein